MWKKAGTAVVSRNEQLADGGEVERTASGNVKPKPPRGRLARAETQATESNRRWESVTSDLFNNRNKLQSGQASHNQFKDELIGTYNNLSTLRSNRAVLKMDLDHARKQVTTVEADLSATELESVDMRVLVEGMRERLKKLTDLHGALQTANQEAARPTSEAVRSVGKGGNSMLDLTKAAHATEDKYQELLQDQLFASVSEIVELEMESTTWIENNVAQRQLLENLAADQQVLGAQQALQSDALHAAETENARLRQELHSARERIVESERNFGHLKGKNGVVEGTISSQNVGIMALQLTYHGEVNELSPRLAKARQRKHEADLMHTQRLEEIDIAGQLAQKANSRPATSRLPPRSAPVSARRPQSHAGIGTPVVISGSAVIARSLDELSKLAAPLVSLESPLADNGRCHSAGLKESSADAHQDDTRPASSDQTSLFSPSRQGRGAATAPALGIRLPELRHGRDDAAGGA